MKPVILQLALQAMKSGPNAKDAFLVLEDAIREYGWNDVRIDLFEWRRSKIDKRKGFRTARGMARAIAAILLFEDFQCAPWEIIVRCLLPIPYNGSVLIGGTIEWFEFVGQGQVSKRHE